MREFTSLEKFTIRGRRVITVALDQEEEREGLLDKIQAEGGVILDGVHCNIDGIESFAITPLRKGMRIGLRIVTDAHSAEGGQ